jgi:hypothetical protein
VKLHNLLSIILVFFIIASPFASAVDLSTTTMTWVVATVKSITVSYGSPCTSSAFFFNESNAQFDSDADGNWAKAVPQSTRTGAGDSNCQSSSQAAMTVTNNGNATVNVDANFTTAMSGADINLELKVWQGSSGCGTFGLGGWEEPCSVTGTTSAPGTTTCKEFSSSSAAATAATRVISSLSPNAATQLCYSGDLNGNTGFGASAGDHNKSFQLGILFS